MSVSKKALIVLVSALWTTALASWICIEPEPNEACGFWSWTESCSTVLGSLAYFYDGNCCSLSDTESGGCLLTVDGPDSFCSWKYNLDSTDDNILWSGTIMMSSENTGQCPASQYNTTQAAPTPAPTRSFKKYRTFGDCLIGYFSDCVADSSPACKINRKSFTNTFSKCVRIDAKKAGKCMGGAVLSKCNSKKGKVPLGVCEKLKRNKEFRDQVIGVDACEALKKRCGRNYRAVDCSVSEE